MPDVVARVVSQALSTSMGQQFFVENKAGAGGVLAVESVIKSPADGYTLLVGETGQLEIATVLYPTPPYDSLKDLKPIGMIATGSGLLVSKANSNLKTLQDVIREAKARPGALNYGSSGVGSFHHIVFEALKAATGINITHIPFKGSGAAELAVGSGDVQIVISTRLDPNRFNFLANPTATRDPAYPQVPTVAEEIKQDFDYTTYVGLLAPAGMAPDAVAKLSGALKSAMATPEVQRTLTKLILAVTWTSPNEYADKMGANMRKFGSVIKAAKIKPE